MRQRSEVLRWLREALNRRSTPGAETSARIHEAKQRGHPTNQGPRPAGLPPKRAVGRMGLSGNTHVDARRSWSQRPTDEAIAEQGPATTYRTDATKTPRAWADDPEGWLRHREECEACRVYAERRG